ncbi:MAG: 23S rRNA (pseudouridine(1915)-N(3))-methyltransferase RlmH [Thermoanaerobaculia bacterium]
MGFELHLLWAGRHSPEPWESLSADYRRRIEAFVPVRERAIRVPAAGDDRSRRRSEGSALAAAAPKSSFLIALDEHGTEWTSEELARQMERWRAEWPHPVVFFLGSDIGLDPELAASCRVRLALGRMTLPHHLARLVLLEQLYRALSIVAGINYHRPTLK